MLLLTIFTANIINVLKAGTADEMGARNTAIAFVRYFCEDWGNGTCVVEAAMINRRTTHPTICAAADGM